MKESALKLTLRTKLSMFCLRLYGWDWRIQFQMMQLMISCCIMFLRAIHSVASHPLEHGESNSNLGSRHHFCWHLQVNALFCHAPWNLESLLTHTINGKNHLSWYSLSNLMKILSHTQKSINQGGLLVLGDSNFDRMYNSSHHLPFKIGSIHKSGDTSHFPTSKSTLPGSPTLATPLVGKKVNRNGRVQWIQLL